MTEDNFQYIKSILYQQSVKVNEIVAEQRRMGDILAVNTDQLKEHVKRTNLLEEHLETRITPIEDHVKFINRLSKVIIPLMGAPAFVYYLVKLIKWQFS